MPSFKTQVPHPLGREEATRRLKGFLDQVREEYESQVSELKETWTDSTLDFAMTTYGFKIEGQLVIDEEVVAIRGTLPLAAVAFRGKIEKSIQQALESALGQGEAP